MDPQMMINLVAGSVLAVLGWFARVLWDSLNRLQEDLHQLEIDLPSHYMRKDEFAESMKRIEGMLEKIFDRLDGKVDKF